MFFHPRQFGRFTVFIPNSLLTQQYNYSHLKEEKLGNWKRMRGKRTSRWWNVNPAAVVLWRGVRGRTEEWREPPPLWLGRSTDETGWKSEGWRTYLPFLESLSASPPPSVLLQGSSLSLYHPASHPSVHPCSGQTELKAKAGGMYDQSAPSGRTLRQINRQK